MLNRALRPLMFVVAFALWGWMLSSVPGYGLDATLDAEDAGLSIGRLIAEAFQPLVLFIALAAALLAGGLRGLGAGLQFLFGGSRPKDPELRSLAQRALHGLSRGYLWSSFGLVLACSVFVSFLSTWDKDLFWLDFNARWDVLMTVAYLALPVYLILLNPSAHGVDPASGEEHSWKGSLDLIALLGHGMLLLFWPLSLLVRKAGIIGVPDSEVFYVLPTWGQVDLVLVGWCLALILVLAGLVTVPQLSASGGRQRTLRGFSFSLVLIGAGVLCSSVIRLAGMQWVSIGGGSGNPEELQALGGRMIVPLVLALLLVGLQRMWCRQPDPQAATVPE